MTEKDLVKIRDYQREHYKKVCLILERYYAYLDNSDTGTGKTPMTCAMAQTFDLAMGVVAPKSSLENWSDNAEKYGIKIKFLLSYESMQGVGGENSKQPKHGLLERNDKKFKATEKFRKHVKKGLLLVFDEVQKLKNENRQFSAAHAFVKCIVEESKKGACSRIALLSATPVDKVEQMGSLLKMLGIITEDKLYNYDRCSKHYELVGLKEAFEFCKQLEPRQTNFIMSKPVNRNTGNVICKELYLNVIKKHLTSAMPPILVKKDAKNGYYDFDEKDLILLKKGIELLSNAVNYRSDTGMIGRSANWGDVTTSLTIIEKSKINTMIRLAKEKLDNDPNCKVVLYFKYLNNIAEAFEQLRNYGALYIIGSKSSLERKEIRVKFQANNNNYRVIISNSQVNGVGVELDDIYGNHPRFMFMIADYRLIDSHQAAGRICRAGSKSIGTIRFVYSKKFPIEYSIINAMVQKSKLVRAVIIDEKNNILLPGEYGIEIEGLENIQQIETDPQYENFRKIWEELRLHNLDK